ncbi:MAG: hypothetical protein AAGM67_20530, partial [Bacteroidota bacterium]
MANIVMPKTLYLHIGTHKTGSTAIQQTLANNRTLLLNNGYLYPESATIGYGHHQLPSAISGEHSTKFAARAEDNSLATLLDELNATPTPNIIISSENFCRLSANEIHKVKKTFASFHIEIIVYLRRQDLLLQSLWIQFTKLGRNTDSFQTWYKRAFDAKKYGVVQKSDFS